MDKITRIISLLPTEGPWMNNSLIVHPSSFISLKLVVSMVSESNTDQTPGFSGLMKEALFTQY